MTDDQLAAILLRIAADMQGRRPDAPLPGVLRQAARRIRELTPESELTAGRCPECGDPVPVSSGGRPAIFCSSRCRLRAVC